MGLNTLIERQLDETLRENGRLRELLTDKDALIGELRVVLVPFVKSADMADADGDVFDDDMPAALSVGDCRKAKEIYSRTPSDAGEKLRRLEQQVSLLFDEFFEPCGGHDERCLACHATGPRYMIEHGEDCHIGHIQDLAALKSGEEGAQSE